MKNWIVKVNGLPRCKDGICRNGVYVGSKPHCTQFHTKRGATIVYNRLLKAKRPMDGVKTISMERIA